MLKGALRELETECLRLRSFVVSDAEAVFECLQYVLSQGTKEDLVKTPRHWCGVSGVKALEKGENSKVFGSTEPKKAKPVGKARRSTNTNLQPAILSR